MKLSHPSRLWTRDLHGHRRVTWLELFFDLIFVAAVAQVGQPLTHDYRVAGLVRHGFLFVLIWCAWSGHTAFVTRFDHDDGVSRILLLVQCFIAAVMAANAKEGSTVSRRPVSGPPTPACGSCWSRSICGHGASRRRAS